MATNEPGFGMPDPYPDDMAHGLSSMGGSWDANGSPVSEPIELPSHDQMAADLSRMLGDRPPAPHICWICGGQTSHKADGLWYAVFRMFRNGNYLNVWQCSKACYTMAEVLVDGLIFLPNQPGYVPLW